MSIKRILEGVTLVLIGAILLLNTTGQLSWSVWWSVLSLWPLLLVAAGLDIVAKGLDTEWLRVLSSLLVIAGIVVGAFVLPVAGGPFGIGWMADSAGSDFDVATGRPARVTEGTASIRGGAGTYTVLAGSAGDLVRVSGRTPFGEPKIDADISGSSADVRVSAPEGVTVWMPHMRGATTAEVALSPEVVWDISIDTGAVDFTADLAGIVISELQMRSGVSSALVVLGEEYPAGREVPVRVRGGVSSFTLEVPRGVPVRIEAEAGLSSVDVDRRVPRMSGDGRVWQTDDWGRGGYDIRFEAGVSSVTVKTY